jgi:hypothetical protein
VLILQQRNAFHYNRSAMPFPVKTCVICSEEFELKPNKPGFANRCPACSEEEATDPGAQHGLNPDNRTADSEMNEARRHAMRDLLYRKDS